MHEPAIVFFKQWQELGLSIKLKEFMYKKANQTRCQNRAPEGLTTPHDAAEYKHNTLL